LETEDGLMTKHSSIELTGTSTSTSTNKKKPSTSRKSGVELLDDDQQDELEEVYFSVLDFNLYSSYKEVPFEKKGDLKRELKDLAAKFGEKKFDVRLWLLNQNRNYPGQEGTFFARV